MMIWAMGDMDISFQTNGNFLIWGSHAMDQWTQGATQNLVQLRSEVNSELNFPPNFEGLVLGCIDADFCK